MKAKPVCLGCMANDCEHIGGYNMPPRLSPRSAQLVAMVGRGLTNKEIAFNTGLSEGTVKVYMSHLFPLLKVSNRVLMALWARDHAHLLSEAA